jgi:hypothetical protein
MKPLSKQSITLIVLATAVVFVVGVFAYQNRPQESEVVEVVGEEEQENQNISDQEFVTDVDMNIEHWQTKEGKVFTIKFPKEWYWLESEHEENEGYSEVITNNLDFDIDRYADIGLFTGGEYLFTSVSEGVESEPIPLQNNEVVITFRGAPTSNSGTPQDSMDSRMANRSANNYDCAQNDAKQLPLRGHCFLITDYNEKIHTYYVITEEISLAITARTTADTMIDEDIIEEIVDSIKIQ